jgi:hypothetical protein
MLNRNLHIPAYGDIILVMNELLPMKAVHRRGGGQMNPFSRFVRSMKSAVARHDSGFETYYGAIAQQSTGGPSAAEARRDYQEARRVNDRIGMY